MRLSLSLQKNALEAGVGAILNRLHFKQRRNIMFFEGIPASYIEACERDGHGGAMYSLGEKWFSLVYYCLLSPFMKALPKRILLPMLGEVWHGIGALDGIKASFTGGKLSITTEGEAITRIIGPNEFIAGTYAGAYGVALGYKLKCIKRIQSRGHSSYTYQPLGPFGIPLAKTKAEFDELNKMRPIRGFSIKDALKSGIFVNHGNKLYFRGELVSTTDSTIYHIIANEKLFLDKIAPISYNFFRGLVEGEATTEQKLRLLKTMFQVMGWGAFTISGDMKRNITIHIRYPPYGFQKEPDNWGGLLQILLGYLWMINPKFRLAKVSTGYQKLSALYKA